jgi:hypothetical protein
MLVRGCHPTLRGLDVTTRAVVIRQIAWHEWGHALSVTRCTSDDIRAGETLLALAPAGVKESIRAARYPRRELTYEVIAEVFALLMARRLAGQKGRPSWLNKTVYELVMRLTKN